jgi:2',3'-cyclic-nucleotide 2'-phosphodiesterase (5'-nucleotidase family)
LRLTILHTNDIHGRIEGLARIATLVEQIRAETPHRVVYVDCGDVEETTSRLSNVTKGAAMHRLMSAAGCRAMTVGNASWFRYGPQVLPEHAANASYPLLCANLRAPGGAQLTGTQDTCVLDVDGIAVGLIGVTAPFEDMQFFDVEVVPAAHAVREHAGELRALGADIVVVLSHLGWDNPVAGLYGDRDLAVDVAGEVDVIVGAHSHSLLPHGETVAGVPVAQAGDYAHHLGRIDFVLDRSARVERISVLQVPEETRLHPRVAAAVAAVEAEVETYLSEIVGELIDPLEYAEDRECSTANFMADVLRERTRADVALMGGTHAITASLPAGPAQARHALGRV